MSRFLITTVLALLLLPQTQAQTLATATTAQPLPAKATKSVPRAIHPTNTYTRLICIVPMTGKGTLADPRRPLYAPGPVLAKSTAAPAIPRSGIIGFSHISSDDGNLALVEFIATDRAALKPILNDKSVTAFEKGKFTQTQIETELRKYRKTFTLANFGVPAL